VKPIYYDTLKRKMLADLVYYIPTVSKSGGTRSPCPHLIAPMILHKVLMMKENDRFLSRSRHILQ